MTTENSQKNNYLPITLLITFARLAPNMGRRVLYPFVPAVSRLLGVPANDVQTVIALQGGMGLFSPLFAPLSARFGRKRVMLGALGLFILAGSMGAIIGTFWAVALTFLLFGIAKMIYDPASQAYLGDRIPYAQRGRALGIGELSWAGALVIGAPIGGLLLESAGLSAVFLMMIVFAGVALVAMAIYLPSDAPHPDDDIPDRTHLRTLLKNPQAVGALAFVVLFISANELFFINYGVWMEASFELSLASLGAFTLVIALAEICGEGMVIAFADTIGKKRMAVFGAGLSVACHLLLPMLNANLVAALIGLFLFFLGFEIGVVASLPILSEILPTERALMMTASASASAIGRMGGAWLGGILYVALGGNMQVLSILTVILGIGATLIMWRVIQEG
ncbi:MAG: MFS transporter [bacterium]|nr:MFS transporter [bacterium]